MHRRPIVLLALVVAALALFVAPTPAAGQTDPTSTTVPERTERLPGTTLEAEERDDGTTSAAPWIIGSGVLALLAIGLGGTLLKRRAAVSRRGSGHDVACGRRLGCRVALGEAMDEARDQPVLEAVDLDGGAGVAEGPVVAERPDEIGDRRHVTTVAPRCDNRGTPR
jgi:hypothetical protein